MPTNQKTKNSRGRRIQTSTTLQFAPPNWFLKLFRKGSNNLMSFPRESNFNFPWRPIFFLNRITSKVFSLPFIFPKLLFIFLCAGMGAAIPFLPIFYSSSLALSSTQIGIVFSIAPFVSAISCPLWTGLADRFHSHRLIIVIIYSLATLGVVSQMILPKVIDIDNKSLKMFFVLFAALWFAFFGIPVNALVDSGVIKILGDKRELYGQQRLWGSVAYGASTFGVGLLWSATNNINVVFFFFFGTALLFTISTLFTDFNSNEDIEEFLTRPSKDTAFKSLIDLEDLDNDGESSTKNNYQKYDGFETRTINVPFNIDESDGEDSSICEDDDDDDGISVPDLDILAFAPTSPNLATASLAANPMTALKTLFSNTSVATLLIVMLLMGIALSMCNSFLLLFLSQELKANSTILGLTGPLSAITELLFFFYSKELISQFGIGFLVSLAHIVTIVRCVTYIFLKPTTFSYVLALLVQLLNGIGFSALWVSGVMHVANNAPHNLISFSQGVMTALYAGIGTGFGSLIGGLLYDSAGGPKAMFGAVVAISIFSLAMYWWGEGGFKINIDHFGGKRRQREIQSPWEGINEVHTNHTNLSRRGILSVETARTKKGRYEMLLQDDDDDEQYHYGVFGEGRL
ncbi:hypothetical protein Glove_85g106 [Diversispora epigaea]|uniref:Major facilitator superfamily associated domain-containing protein n=1 Tax=Diversispora epigaea TaxID=1348612 RepID=A0A397J9C1_9GLOM|nr:hypothetical protein Glove_85g106 [Diversispora epigaea]